MFFHFVLFCFALVVWRGGGGWFWERETWDRKTGAGGREKITFICSNVGAWEHTHIRELWISLGIASHSGQIPSSSPTLTAWSQLSSWLRGLPQVQFTPAVCTYCAAKELWNEESSGGGLDRRETASSCLLEKVAVSGAAPRQQWLSTALAAAFPRGALWSRNGLTGFKMCGDEWKAGTVM